MREIKFRAWFPQEKKMRDIDLGEQIHDVTEWFIAERDGKIMQFTGLTDKNGKEIYEGDILQDNFGAKFEVYWQDGMFVVGNWKDNKFWMKNLLNQYVEIEIIGNKYSNPELIA